MRMKSFAGISVDLKQTAGQVGNFLKARDAERDNVFNRVLAMAGYLVATGAMIGVVALVLEFCKIFDATLGIYWYLSGFAYLCMRKMGEALHPALGPFYFGVI